MADTQPDNNDDGGMGNYAKFTGIAFQMIAVIGIFAFIGYEIDKHAGHTTKWVTAISSLIGVLIAMYLVIKSLKN